MQKKQVRKKGEKIYIKETLNERAEAEFIIDKVDELIESGNKISGGYGERYSPVNY